MICLFSYLFDSTVCSEYAPSLPSVNIPPQAVFYGALYVLLPVPKDGVIPVLDSDSFHFNEGVADRHSRLVNFRIRIAAERRTSKLIDLRYQIEVTSLGHMTSYFSDFH